MTATATPPTARTDHPASGRAMKWAVRSAVVLAILVVVLELGLRTFFEPAPPLMGFDKILGYRPIPGVQGQSRDGTRYGINSKGWRDSEHAVAKPADTVRIAVLGDCFVMAMAVEPQQRWTRELEVELNRTKALGDKKIEVLNFGVSGYGMTQHLLTLRHHVWKYDPDLVLCMFSAGSDIERASRQLWQNHDRPFFEMNGTLPQIMELITAGYSVTAEDVRGQSAAPAIALPRQIAMYLAFRYTHHTPADIGRFLNRDKNTVLATVTKITKRRKMDRTFHDSLADLSQRLTRSVLKADNRFRAAQAQRTGPGFLRRNSRIVQTVTGLSTDLQQRLELHHRNGWTPEVYGEPPGRRWTEAWDVALALLTRMQEEVRAKNRRLAVVMSTAPLQVHHKAELQARFMSAQSVSDLTYPNRTVLQHCHKADIPVFDLRPVFWAYGRTNKAHLHGRDGKGFGDWNVGGHRLAADNIAAWIIQKAPEWFPGGPGGNDSPRGDPPENGDPPNVDPPGPNQKNSVPKKSK